MQSGPQRRKPYSNRYRPSRMSQRRMTLQNRRFARRLSFVETQRRARMSMRKFRQGTLLAVALAGLLLIIFSPQNSPAAAELSDNIITAADTGAVADAESAPSSSVTQDAAASAEEATGTLRNLFRRGFALWPKILIILLVMFGAWALYQIIRFTLLRLLRNWSKAEALGTLIGIIFAILSLGIALSILAGDVRALAGAVGFASLALSWALQAPIESFSGYLLNAFRLYYRVGDRIAVGDVFGDVYEIDMLTTTVWECGGPGKAVESAQPTGAFVTFPNSEVLRNNIINYTRDLEYVWDEVKIGVANESDLAYAASVIRGVAMRVIGPEMEAPSEAYRRLLERRGLDFEVDTEPHVYITPTESWADIAVRYMVHARQRRLWSSRLNLALAQELALPEHRNRIKSAYPVRRIEYLGKNEQS